MIEHTEFSIKVTKIPSKSKSFIIATRNLVFIHGRGIQEIKQVDFSVRSIRMPTNTKLLINTYEYVTCTSLGIQTKKSHKLGALSPEVCIHMEGIKDTDLGTGEKRRKDILRGRKKRWGGWRSYGGTKGKV